MAGTRASLPQIGRSPLSTPDNLGVAIIETSAKMAENIDEAFLSMEGELIQQRDARVASNTQIKTITKNQWKIEMLF